MSKSIEQSTAVLIMAGGKGTRLSQRTFGRLPKPLVHLNKLPIIDYIIFNIINAGINKNNIYLMVNYQKELLISYLQDQVNYIEITFPVELGTWYAIKSSKPHLSNKYKNILIIYGDMPFIKAATLQKLLEKHNSGHSILTFLTNKVSDPMLYDTARVIRDNSNKIIKVQEQKYCSPEELLIRERSIGPAIYKTSWIYENISVQKYEQRNKRSELYITKLVEIAAAQNQPIQVVLSHDESESYNINTLEQLQAAEGILEKQNPLDNFTLQQL